MRQARSLSFPAEIDRRLRPLEEVGEKQVVIDIWVLHQLLNQPTAYGGRAAQHLEALGAPGQAR
jgi:hypothetical protein